MMGVRKFTPDECDLIKREYLAHVPVSEIANKLGRSVGTVRQKILSLKLRRPRLGTRLAPGHLKALAGKIPPNEWRAKYSSWQREQSRQAREQKLQAQALAGQHIAAKCAEIDAREDLTRSEKIAAKLAAGMTLQAIGEQHGISRERVRQIAKKIKRGDLDRTNRGEVPRAVTEAAMPNARASLRRNLEGSAMSRNEKNRPGAPHPWRLQAVMECLNPKYAKSGGQKKFAEDIGVTPGRLNNIVRGRISLSRKMADAIFLRFKAEGVTLSFLHFGLVARGMYPEFERKLLEWQDRNGKKIIVSEDEVFHQIREPHEAPTMKAKTAVEVDPIARLQAQVDFVRNLMVSAPEPTMRSAVVIAALRVVITKAQELIAELQSGNTPPPPPDE